MRTRVGLAMMALTLAPWGCTMVGPRPGPPPPPRAQEGAPPPGPAATPREFGGRAHLGGESVEMVLELTPLAAPRDSAVLRIPDMAVEAHGAGTWSGRSLRLELYYGDGCPGTIRLSLDVDEQGTQADGTLEARDCTGTESGPVSLLRRGMAPPRPQAAPRIESHRGPA